MPVPAWRGDGTAMGQQGQREWEHPQGGGSTPQGCGEVGTATHSRGPAASIWVCSFISASLSRAGLSPSLPWPGRWEVSPTMTWD